MDNLFEGVDFTTTLTRAKFESLVQDQFQKTIVAVKRAMRDAELTVEEIHEVRPCRVCVFTPCTRACVRVFACVCARVRVCVCLPAYVHACVCVCLPAYVHACVCVCVCLRMCTRGSLCVSASCLFCVRACACECVYGGASAHT